MKWYPIARLAAVTVVTMSCFCAELQALQFLFLRQWDCQGLALVLLYIVKFPDSRCRPLVSLSDNLNLFQRCRGGGGGGSISCVRIGRERHPAIRKDHRLIFGIHFFLACARKSSKNRLSIHYSSSCRGEHLIGTYCHGHSQVQSSLAAQLAACLPLPVAPDRDFWPQGKCIAAAVDEHTVGNLRQRRFRGDGDRSGRASLEQRQPSLPSKIRTLRSQ